MHAVVHEKFDGRPKISNFPDPKLFPGAVMLKVETTGVYRSDWRMGHDAVVAVPDATSAGAHVSLDALGHGQT
ncbi:MAG: hypothetical protein AAGJ89_10070 [Pseudomonadota bacterium]